MKTIETVCGACGKTFQKIASEYKRSLKLGRSFHCSRSCSSKLIGLARAKRGDKIGKSDHLVGGSFKDEFSPFRYFLWKIRSRHKKFGFAETDITLKFLKELWETQKGKCILTGWNLILPESLSDWSKTKVTKNTASLDRLVSKEPYKIGNVRFVSHIANMAKHTYTDEDVVEFCKAVAKHNS